MWVNMYTFSLNDIKQRLRDIHWLRYSPGSVLIFLIESINHAG